ncbi:hypothetical protein FALCPG4_009510 [Fusarium falciforme]
MADWGQTDQGGSSQWNTGGQDEWDTGKQDTNNFGNDGGFDNGGFANGDGFNNGGFENGDGAENGHANDNDKCFGCGETGHRRAECPNPQEMACRYCKQPGHMVKDCPDKPPMVCENCGEEGHMRKNCENARKINRDHIADVSLEEALNKIKQAVTERDVDDAKEGVQEYIKATNGEATYRDVQTALIEKDIGLWLIASEKPLLQVFANMDLQGNIGKKYTVSYRFTEKADRPREVEGWPKDRDELLSRLDDAGEVVDKGMPLCSNCKELGHISKYCTQEKAERTDAPKISCYNCGGEGHRVRDCPEPRVDKFACKNCGLVAGPDVQPTSMTDIHLANLVTRLLIVRSPLTRPMSSAASAMKSVTSPRIVPRVVVARAATVARRAIWPRSATSLVTCPASLAVTAISRATTAESVPSPRTGARSSAQTASRWATQRSVARNLPLTRWMEATSVMPTTTLVGLALAARQAVITRSPMMAGQLLQLPRLLTLRFGESAIQKQQEFGRRPVSRVLGVALYT